LKRFFL